MSLAVGREEGERREGGKETRKLIESSIECVTSCEEIEREKKRNRRERESHEPGGSVKDSHL